MRRIAKVGLLLVAVILSGCGTDDPLKEVRGQFLQGCVQSGVSKTQCQCAFKELAEDYDASELRALSRPSANISEEKMQELIGAAVNAMMVCDG